MFRILLNIALCCVLFYSCMSGNVLNVDTVRLDDMSFEDPQMDDVSYVMLKSAGNIFGDPCTVKYRNHRFYLFDSAQGVVAVYDEVGNQLGIIKAMGHGHGEYVMPLSFDVDAEGNVFVADASSGTIYEYGCRDFKFKQQIDVGVRFCGLGVISENEFWITSYIKDMSLDGKLAYYNAATKEFKDVCKPVVKGEGSVTHSFDWDVFRSDSVLYFYERFTPYAYRVDKGGVCSDTLMIETSMLPDKKDINKAIKSNENILTSRKFWGAYSFFVENGNAFMALNCDLFVNVWYSAEKDKFFKFRGARCPEIKNLGTNVIAVTDSHYVSIANIDRLKDIKKEKLSSFEQEILQSVEEQGDDSPIVLLLYRLK